MFLGLSKPDMRVSQLSNRCGGRGVPGLCDMSTVNILSNHKEKTNLPLVASPVGPEPPESAALSVRNLLSVGHPKSQCTAVPLRVLAVNSRVGSALNPASALAV